MCANLAIDLQLNEQNERPSRLNDVRTYDVETDGGGTVDESDRHLRQTRQSARSKDKSAMDKPCECHVEKTTPPPTTGYLTKETFRDGKTNATFIDIASYLPLDRPKHNNATGKTKCR